MHSWGVLVAQLVLRHSCVADRLPVVVRFPAGPRVSLKSGDQPKGRWRRPKKKKTVKKYILEHMTQLGSQYIRNKVLTSGWTGGIGWKWLSEARETNKRWIPGVTRFALLRWAVNEDDDEWLARRGQSRQKRCIHCTNQGRAYPFGGHQVAICETCICIKQITAFTLHIRNSPPNNLQRIETMGDQSARRGLGEMCCMRTWWQHRRPLGQMVHCTHPCPQGLNWRCYNQFPSGGLTEGSQTTGHCLTGCSPVPTATSRSRSHAASNYSTFSPPWSMDQ